MIDTEALRKKVIDLAIQGKLTQQLPEDGNTEDLYAQIQKEKTKLIKEGKIKKGKPLPDITDDEVPFTIPSNWKWCRLGDIYIVLMGQSPEGINVGLDVDGMEFHQGKIFFGDKFLNQSNQKTCELTRIADANSVLLCVRAPVGVVNITERQICIGRGLCALSTILGMEPYYLFYYLLSCRKSFEQSGTGSTFSSITADVVKKHLIPLPPLEEQRRIVNLLDSVFNQFAVIDTLQKKYESDREILKGKIIEAGICGQLTEQLPEDGNAEDLYSQIQEKKSKLMREGGIKKEKSVPDVSDDEIPFEIPMNWKWIRLNDIGVFKGGKTPSMNNEEYWCNGTVPWITSKDMKRKYISSSRMLISESASRELTVFPKQTILFVVRSGILRRLFPVAILSEEGTINQDLKALSLYDSSMCEYVYYLLKGFESTILSKYTKDGTTVNNIMFDSLLTMPIPLPPLSEQKRIVNIFNQLTDVVT